MSARPVRLRRTAGLAEVEIASAASGNCIDVGIAQELCAAAEEIAGDEAVSVVLLSTRGRSFCAGADANSPDWAAALASVPQPVIAAVQGDAIDEGAELALLADLRVCARSARFRFSHIAQGRLPSHGATQRLPRAVGRMRALDILLSGRWVGAAEAARIGLATAIAPAGGALPAARRIAIELAGKGPLATRYAKEAVVAGSDMTLAQGIRLEQDLYVLLQTTADREEGVDSFLERRRPRFRGR